MIKRFLVLAAILGQAVGFAAQAYHGEQSVCAGFLSGRLPYVVYDPPAGTLTRMQYVFLTGFADAPENWAPFFRTLADEGVRVISITYPSHGKATGVPLGFFTVPSLVNRAILPVLRKEIDTEKPYVLGGWSTGGTLVEYLVQSRLAEQAVGLKPSGVVEIAPGLPVKLLPGSFGLVTKATLTHEPQDPFWQNVSIRPRTPFFHPLFALSLAVESHKLRQAPADRYQLPTLLMVSADNDAYVDAPTILKWGQSLAAEPESMVQVVGFRDGVHALQWEPHFLKEVAQLTRVFLLNFR